ncbi:MAG: polysaccharide biosynthesis tyrosine autokinase [Halioglobus sp.]
MNPSEHQANSVPQSMDDDFIDLGRLLRAVLRHKWGILGFAFAVTLVSGLFVYAMEPVYSASASIVLESQQANVVNVEEIYTYDTYDYNYSQTQYEILKSRSLAERVVRRLQLHKHPHYAGEASDEPDESPWYSIDLKALLPAREQEPPVQFTQEELDEMAIRGLTGAVAGGLQISPVEYSYVVYLSYESTNPRLAAQIVNVIAEEFIASNLETRLEGTLQATDWLDERLAILAQNLSASEQALQDFRDREGLVSVEGITGLGGSELQILSQRLQEAQRARIEAENIKEEVQGLADASIEELLTIPAVLQHQVIRDIKREQSAAERSVAELGKRYGARHPRMIAAESDLKQANADLAQEVRKVVSGISREYEIAQRNEQQLQADWEARKSEMQEFNRTEFRLQELQREVEANRQLYDIFFTRIKSVSETGGFEKPHARIVDRAMVPVSPVKPNKRLSITLAFVLGIMLGCAVAVLLDMLDNTIKSPDDVSEKLNAPLLGYIPVQDLDAEGRFEQFWEKPQGIYAESIRTIRTGVVLSSLNNPAKIIVVTSTVPGEGKSTTVLNLGSAMGQMERTLVIGADLRRPSLAQKCKLEPNHNGLSHFVAGTTPLEQCIEHMADLHLDVMPAGIIPPNPLEMISSSRFIEALAELRERYDRIVIDSAPVQAVSDALILSSYADAVIYVVKADATPATAVQKGIASIRGSNEPLAGVVLNHFNAKRASRTRYGDRYYQYGDYYQADEKA